MTSRTLFVLPLAYPGVDCSSVTSWASRRFFDGRVVRDNTLFLICSAHSASSAVSSFNREVASFTNNFTEDT